MGIDKVKYLNLQAELENKNVTLVAVSKMKPVEDILDLYNLGHRDFGENYVQELLDKQTKLPQDIRWHFIGHLQSNKVKYIAPFIHLIHGIDSFKLLKEVNKQGKKAGRVIDVLLQVHIAREQTKFGLDETELEEVINANNNELSRLSFINIQGLMGMASFSDDPDLVRMEFRQLKDLFIKYRSQNIAGAHFQTVSMGMSDDFRMAIEEGSTMVRIGSLIFGRRSLV